MAKTAAVADKKKAETKPAAGKSDAKDSKKKPAASAAKGAKKGGDKEKKGK